VEAALPDQCPECGSPRVFKDGFRPAPLYAASQDPIQRYRCAEYGHRFSSHILNTSKANLDYNHVSANLGAKNMVPTQKIKTCAETEKSPTPTAIDTHVLMQIEKLLTQQHNDGRSEAVLRNYNVYLNLLIKNGADLFDPENTKAVLADLSVKKSCKRLIASILNTWYDFNGIWWKKPTYNKDSEVPYIPTEQELDQLIAGLGKKTSTFCQILKDTGARCGEVAQLTWNDIDFKQHTVNIKAEKRSNGRILPITDKTIGMLANLKHKGNKLFSCTNALRGCYYSQRKRIAQKISNPNILKIHFHTFRHWKATSDLHLYHDRERVQIILGHKSANSTETYVHIDKMLYLSQSNDNFIVKVCDDIEEAVKLMEVGFDFHIQLAGHSIFRKRK
jgi:integrase